MAHSNGAVQNPLISPRVAAHELVYASVDGGKSVDVMELQSRDSSVDHMYSDISYELDPSLFESSPMDEYIMDPNAVYTPRNAANTDVDSSYKRRFNPIYTHSVTDAKTDEKDSSLPQFVCFLMILTSLFLVLAAGSIGLSVYLLVTHEHQLGQEQTNQSLHQMPVNGITTVQPKFDQVKGDPFKEIYEAMSLIHEQLRKINQTNVAITSLRADLNLVRVNIATLKTKANGHTGNLSEEWSNFRTFTEGHLANSSKVPGPQGLQGPVGRANFQSCFYAPYVEHSGADSANAVETLWSPSSAVVENFTVMATTCSVEGGLYHNLETRLDPRSNKRQYRCICSGKTDSAILRVCTNHFWICPRIQN